MARVRSARKQDATRVDHKPRNRFKIKPTGLEQSEFREVRAERQRFDTSSWSFAIAARAQMPRWPAKYVDPAIGKLVRGVKTPAFLGAQGVRARIKPAKPFIDSGIELSVVTVDVKGKPADGTLIVPVAEKSLREIDPRSLALHKWDEEARRYDLVHQSALELAGGYIYGRITGSGRYAVLGLPVGDALKRVKGAGRPIVASMLYDLIIRRVFDPTGPWSPLGPLNLSCCIMDLAIDPAHSDRIYAAASDGGIWRLDSIAGYPTSTWQPLTDGQPSLRIQCMAASPADSAVLYYVDGSGMMHRSADRGDTWATPSTTYIGVAQRLIAHPTDSNTVYVASSTGFWCSHSGGATWVHNTGQATLHDGDILDAAMDPGSASILYIAQRGVGLRKSYDGGATWGTMLPWSRATMPTGSSIRVAVGRGGTDATRTVAVRFGSEVLVNRRGGRGTGTLGGGPWTSAGVVDGSGYGDWCHVIAIDPFNDNVILSGGQQLMRSTNGGTSWTLVIDYYSPHEDQHRVLFDPTQIGVVYAANDGGVFRSTNGGATWNVDADDVVNRRDLTRGLVTAQFYTAAMSGDHAMGNLYHQGIAAADSLRLGDWEGVEGHSWEFNSVYGDPTRAGTYYIFGGQLFRRTFPGGGLTAISTFVPTAVGVDGAGNLLTATTDGTVRRTGDPTVATPSWTTMAGLSSPSDPVRVISFAPSSPRLAYAATGNGRIYSCADTGAPTAWVARTALPTGGVVAIAVSVEDAAVVFAATSTDVYRSTNGGGSWTAVNGTAPTAIPPGSLLHSLVAGPGALYAGAVAGVFTSPDRGNTWFDFSGGLPNVELKQILWTERDLFAVTHGRGIWHHGRYDIFRAPGPFVHAPDLRWLIRLWLAIHGGDPAPDAIRQKFGKKVQPFRQGKMLHG